MVSSLLFIGASPLESASNKVRVSSLSDVAFGSVANLTSDAIQSQSLCLFSDTVTASYNVTAVGSGLSGAFELASGTQTLPYDVQWSGAPNRTSGSQLTPNVPLVGQTSNASHQVCSNGPATTASLVILLRATALSKAVAGTYSGTLTLIVGPE
jgi:spore coat protein U-like protein